MRALIDTCVLVDAIQKRVPFWQDAATLLYAAAAFRFEGFTTAKALTDIHYLMRRAFHDERKTRQSIQRLLRLVSVLDTFAEDSIGALDSSISDFEDAVMAQTALRCDIDCIVTRNLRDYTACPISVRSPRDFLIHLQ
ncbi:MAG: PIN domain-containing protein [Synergistaceae bacterium]|nr:PIN domain-containing protein [Synergistaceae bacterium]